MNVSLHHSNSIPYPQPTNGYLNIDALFLLNENALLAYVNQFSDSMIFANLLLEVWNCHTCAFDEKHRVIETLASHENFECALVELLNSDPSSAFSILFSIEGNNKTQNLNQLLSHLSPKDRRALFHDFIDSSDLSTQANFFSMIEDDKSAEKFVEVWGKKYESFKDAKAQLQEFICLFIQRTQGEDTEKNPLLFKLIAFQNMLDFLDLTLKDLPDYTSDEQIRIASCLIPKMNRLIKSLEYPELTSYLNNLISTPIPLENKADLAKIFFDRILEFVEIEDLLDDLLSTKSPAAPFLWTNLSDNCFEELTLTINHDLRTQMLKLTTTASVIPLGDFVDYLYENPVRAEYILQSSLNIASQNYMEVDGEPVSQMLTFKELGTYVTGALHANFLEFIMTGFQDDFHAVPPFLFALGLRDADHKNWILKAAKYCSDEQRQAIAASIPMEECVEIINSLAEGLMTDQTKLMLEQIPDEIFRRYLESKTNSLKKEIELIQENYHQLEHNLEQIADGPDAHNEIVETEKLLSLQSTLIQKNKTPVMRLLRVVSMEKQGSSAEDIWQAIPNLLNDLDQNQKKLNQYYLRFSDLSPPQAQSFPFTLEDLPHQKLKLLGIESWNEVGIYEPKDLACIDFHPEHLSCFERYIHQEDIVNIWKFLKSKHLTTLNELIEMSVAELDELFNLESVAEKLAWKE